MKVHLHTHSLVALAILLGVGAGHGFSRLPSGTPLPSARTHRQAPDIRVPLPDGTLMVFAPVFDRDGKLAFYLSDREPTVGNWNAVVSDARKSGASNTPLCLSLEEARFFCRALSDLSGRRARLPDSDEWQLAATQLHPNVPYPWGWGPRPRDLFFDERVPGSPSRRGTSSMPYADLAGGRWEWLADGRAAGSAWSERDPDTLRVHFRAEFPSTYEDSDVTLRVLLTR